MSPEEIEAVARRPTYCKTDGEAVTLSRAERDALVAMARDGLRLRWLDNFAHSADWVAGEPIKLIIYADTGAEYYGQTWASAIDEAMATEKK